MQFLKRNLSTMGLATVLVLSVFLLLLAAGISYRQVMAVKKSQESVVLSYKICLELEQLSSLVSHAETGQRGFLITRDSTFLQPYYQSLEKIKWSFSRLDMLTTDNYKQSQDLDTLMFFINQRLRFLDHVLINNGTITEEPDSLRKTLLRGKEMMSMALSQIDKMVFNELQLLREYETRHANDIRFSPLTILFVVAFSILVFILSFYKINNELKGMAKANNELMINNKMFGHSEQIADISHWYWNIKQNKITYSLNLYRLIGCKAYEFEPTFENFLQFVHPADRHLLIESKKRILRDITPAITYFRVIRKDGETRYFKSIGKLITDNSGAKFSIGIHADITGQQNKDKLIGEKLSDLERSNKQLSAFGHIASHDLQEPLRKVQTFISRIKENEIDSVPDNVKDYLSGIRKETIRMQKFITDLLLYSRASKADKTFEMADLNEILENSKKELSHRIEEKNVVINSASDLPVMNVITFQMQQMFSNLISNSIKYSNPSVTPIIEVTAEKTAGKDVPGFTGDSDSKFYKISFSDNGIGFDQQYADKIFTLFYRLHSNSEFTGTGIGLAICKIIAENHRGFISAQGSPGKGSVFNIFLPAK